MKKFKTVTLGCRTNQYESQGYADQLKAIGYSEAEAGEAADLCIVNTCTVTASADSHSRAAMNRLQRENPNAKLVVTGCMAESLQAGGAFHIIPNARKEKLLEEILPEEDLPEFQIKTFDDHTRAFVKVQDGCNSFCTYCIIPYVRGRSRSRPIADVVREVEGLIANGYKEVVLTGINVGDFEEGLANLVRAVDKIPGLQRLRISSIDPDEVNDDLASAVLEGKTTCPSMHIVLQAGSNVILKRMNRKYTRQCFQETVEKMRKANPDFTFTTDIIVGFPGETDADFEETLSIVREVRFAKVHMFPFSPRKRTRAALYPDKVAPDVIAERKQKLLRLSEETGFLLREQFIGRTMPVLLENERKNGFLSGHTPNFLRVWVKDGRPNEIVNVTLTRNEADGFYEM